MPRGRGRNSRTSGPKQAQPEPRLPPLRRQHRERRRGEGGAPGPFVPGLAADRGPRQSFCVPRQL